VSDTIDRPGGTQPLGRAELLGVFAFWTMLAVLTTDAASVYGAYAKVGDLPAGTHYQLEDDGVLPGGASDGGHHDDMAMGMMNAHLAIANHM